MNYKTIALIITFSILIGFLIYWFTQDSNKKKGIITVSPLVQSFITSPAPTPTPPPFVNSSSNLEESAKSLAPKDFSDDIKKLKEEVNSF